MKKKMAGLFLLMCFTAGCATVQIPKSKLALEPLAGAPILLIQTVDGRESIKMGLIGASTFKLASADAVQAVQAAMQEMLYQDQISGDILAGGKIPDETKIRQLMADRTAKGLFVLEILSAKVSSVDLLLDEPHYTAEIRASFYDYQGSKIYSRIFQGEHQARPMTLSGHGKAMAEALRMAVSRAKSDAEFLSYKQKLSL